MSMKTKERRQRIDRKISLHNEFTIKITEFETPACDQVKDVRELKAFNVVLNQGLAKVRNHFTLWNLSNGELARIALYGGTALSDSYERSFGGFIRYGSGDTTPAATDTTLDVDEGYKQASSASDAGVDWTNRYAWYTQKITITPSEEIGTVFKEVGLASYSTEAMLSSRALIVDSEGSPLSITKTSTMQIEIFSKLYFILDTVSYGNTDWVDGNTDGNAILRRFAANTGMVISGSSVGNVNYQIATGTNDTAIDDETDDAVETELFTVIRSVSNFVSDNGSYGLLFSYRLETDESNGKIKEWGVRHEKTLSGGYLGVLFRSVMPVTGVYTGTTFTDVEIGTGDGAEDTFYLQETDEQSQTWTWNEINESYPTIKVNGVTQTYGTDYTYNDSTGAVVFESGSIPGSGLAITGSWSVPYIAKSNDYVIDLEIGLTFAEGTVPS